MGTTPILWDLGRRASECFRAERAQESVLGRIGLREQGLEGLRMSRL